MQANENIAHRLKIYQTFHKEFHRNEDCDWIVPIGVNGYQAPGVQPDSEGANIAALNPWYNELTAFYWVWKNSDADIVGFYHYRRYLNYVIDETWNQRATVGLPTEAHIVEYLTHPTQCAQLRRMLNVSDIVLPKTVPSLRSVEDHYLHFHEREPWEAFMAELEVRYPDHHSQFDIFRVTGLTPICNIFAMRRTLFNEYCEELFPVIDSVFKKIGPRYDSYNNRYPGFLAERFLGFWLHIRGLRSIEVPLIQLM